MRVRTEVVERRRFRWLTVDERLPMQSLLGEPLAGSDRFRVTLSTDLLAERPFDALAIARAGLASEAWVDDIAVAELQVAGFHATTNPHGIGATCVRPGLEHGQLDLWCILATRLLDAPRGPSVAGEITLEAALWKAQACGFCVVVNEVVDRGRHWFFPVMQIGTVGIVVEKSNGHATAIGSGLDRELSFWAYDRGLLDPTRSCLVVEEVLDLERTLDVIRAMRRSVRYETRRDVADRLAMLPARFPHTLSWMVASAMRRAEDAFRWRASVD
jgi:hypothetical protein